MKEKGIALIMCLMLIMILVVVVSQMSYSTNVDSFVAFNQSNDLQNRYALISAVNLAIAYLQIDATLEKDENQTYDCLNDSWAEERKFKINDTDVFYTIEDESSKFNLNCLLKDVKPEKKKDGNKTKKDENETVKPEEKPKKKKEKKDKKPPFLSADKRFNRILDKVIGKEKEKIAKSIKSWIKNKEGRVKEKFPKKTPLYSIKELLMASDITPQIIYGNSEKKGLIDYVTIWSDKRININTADIKILMSLSKKMTEEIAGRIIKHRKEKNEAGDFKVFKKVADLKKVEGISTDKDKDKKNKEKKKDLYGEIEGLLTTKSEYFTIKAIAMTEKMKKKIRVVVYRSGKRIHKIYSEFED